jgi:chromosome segregation ATPase
MLQNEAKEHSEGDIELVAGNIKNDISLVSTIENPDMSNSAEVGKQQILDRIEAKIDVIAQSDVSEYVELFLTQLRKNVEDIRDYLSSKTSGVFDEMETLKEEVIKIKEYLAKSESHSTGYYTEEPLDTEELNNLVKKLSSLDSFEDNVGCVLNEVRFLSDRFSENMEGLAKNLSENISFKDVIDPILEQIGKIKEELKEFTEFTDSGKDLFDKISGQIVILRDVSKKADLSNDGILELKHIVADVNQTLSKAEFFKDDLNGFSNYVEGITDNFKDLNSQFQDLILKFKELRSDISDINLNTNKVSIRFEDDSKLIRDSLEDFQDKLKEFSESNASIQDGNKNKLSNITLVVTESAKDTSKKVDNLTKSFHKLNESNSNVSDSLEVVKSTIIQLAQWIDNAKNLLEEDHAKIIEIGKKTGNQEILSELETVKKSTLSLIKEIEAGAKTGNQEILSEIETVKQATLTLMNRYEEIKTLQNKQDELLNFVKKNSVSVSNNFISVNEKLEESVKQILDSKCLQNHEKKIENLLLSIKKKIEADAGEILNSNAFRNQEYKIDTILDAIKNFYQQEEGIYSILKGYNSQFGIQFDNIGQSLRNVSERVLSLTESHSQDKIVEQIANGIQNQDKIVEKIINELQNREKGLDPITDEIKNLNQRVGLFEKDISETLMELSQNLADVAESNSNIPNEPADNGVLIEIKKDVELELYKINRKIDNFEVYLSKIDEKLDKIKEHNFAKKPDTDDRDLLEYIAGQASSANKNTKANDLIINKIDLLEKRLNSYGSQIKKITDLIEGED